MTTPKIAESGWVDFVIDNLRLALKAAEDTASDIARLRMCDSAGCGRMFDSGDPRSVSTMPGGVRYDFCPACNMEAQAAAAADEIERLQRCHRIVARQAGFYKPELPDFTKVDIHLGVLRAAERCAGFVPWEGEEEEASLTTGDRRE